MKNVVVTVQSSGCVGEKNMIVRFSDRAIRLLSRYSENNLISVHGCGNEKNRLYSLGYGRFFT